MTDLPILAVTVGDVAGVGPELALRAIASPKVRDLCIPKLLGPTAVVEKIAQKLGLPMKGDLLDVGAVEAENLEAGRFTAATGRASFDAVCMAIDMAMTGRVAGIVTGPIQKEAWKLAGIRYAGHTELLADRTGSSRVRMMLTSELISCVLVTIHVPLADVPSLLTIDAIEDAIRQAAHAMRRRRDGSPRITVCGLNPHAGEHGMFSHGEEEAIIQPAIDRCRHDGLIVDGPLPPDTAFTPGIRENTDVYVCMYHDQGLIPLKALSFDDAVNVTLGLPIVRTSVDHGTALDLAWSGQASDASFRAAIEMAVDLADDSTPVSESTA